MSAAEIGTLYLAPNGDAYRLRGFSTDWQALEDAEKRGDVVSGVDFRTIPDYSVAKVRGSYSLADELPDGAVVIWTPSGIPAPESPELAETKIVWAALDYDSQAGVEAALRRQAFAAGARWAQREISKAARA